MNTAQTPKRSRARVALATALATLLLFTAATAARATETVTVIEYYNAALDAYFITARPSEQAILDGAAGFSRTGMRFVANAAADASAAQTRICRFYISGTAPFVSSHFYGAETRDCVPLLANLPAGFSFEGYDFAVASPDASGNCPAATRVPVYRAFRAAANGKTPNHRYTPSLNEYNRMVALGWSAEGVAYCTTAAQYPIVESARISAVQ